MTEPSPATEGATRPSIEGLGRRVIRNLSILSVSQVVGLAISVITAYVLVRQLPEGGFGAFSYAFSVLFFAMTLADPGLTPNLVRDIAQQPERTEFLVQRAMGLRLASALGVMLLLWCGAFLWLDEPVRSACLLISLVLPLQAFGVVIAVLQARTQVKRGVAIELVNRFSGFGVMMIAVFAGAGTLGVVAGVVVGEAAGLAVLLWLTREVVRPRPRADVAVWRGMVRGTLTVGAAMVLGALVNRLDYFMLEQMAGLETLDVYAAAYRLPQLLERIPLLALSTVFPLMSRLAVDDRAALRTLYRWAALRAAALAIVLVSLLIAAAPWIVEAWFGAAFLPAVPALRWLLASTGCMYVAVVAGNVLIAIRQTRLSVAIWALAAPLNVVLNLLWIPTSGATGAAAATCASFALALVLCLIAVERTVVRP